MNKLLLGLTFVIFFTVSSSNVFANHCAGGHGDKVKETSTSTSEENNEKEKK